ncbi:DUF6265 family protein [Asticcacaulis sp. YBE204]|uniref:DUF6265 family protein n=1 Tax=Asticcacaulis sp. YBE204 TaxID=1282363 RepID=UPI0003C3C27D|nr:DUF6265 family protein [Asticcacaulis sp. YBE204]ESQ80466.1 hypothetical protein AEYBE204_04155 [Asticcacaulis sp. YBE204]
MKYLIVAGLLLSGSAQAQTVVDLSWLTGCWVQDKGARNITEHWTPADGGQLFGIGRTFSADKVLNYEFMVLGQRDGVLTFTAYPSGQAGASFPLKTYKDGEAVFENAAHDFPQRVIYKRGEGGTMSAAIEGTIKGQAKRIDFSYVTCPK